MRDQLSNFIPGIIGVFGIVFILVLIGAEVISGVWIALAVLGLVILMVLIAVFIHNL